jgi:2,3-bisphosphoglycerate-independent phosphoglycerate mutase
MTPLLLVFLDGVGVGAPSDDNPFSALDLPALRSWLGGDLVSGCGRREADRQVSEIDANLGVEGLPQSATGQATLFTGVNAARHMGRHVAAYPGPRLKALLDEHGLLARLDAAGRRVAFANAFSARYLEELVAGRRRVSVTVHLALRAGLRLRTESDLEAGSAISWDLERDLYGRALDRSLSRVDPETAGAQLAALAAEHDLTLYESFLTDLAGHGRWQIDVASTLRRIDRFLGGLRSALPDDMTALIVSDHGNVEEPEHRRHTRNPVPLAALGPAARDFASVRSLADVTPAVFRALARSAGDS